ncbi:hypothetical protein [Methanolobus sp. ZRKC5]|uniref:hypothetical protein n=1 Tax=unclassified Methanolobus TaxID=2629569 RepID=UPI00313EFEFA
MRIRNLLLLIVLFSMLSLPASAAYEWDNTIDIGTDGMVWGYTETYSGDRSVVFKTFIDMEFGDNDGFVSSWELLKTDVKTSKSFLKTIENNMDVKIDNSSKNVTLLDVEADMSAELIGLVGDEKDIMNKYQVFYDFKTPLTESDTSMWFQGQPETDVTVHLPSEIKLVSVEGIDNKSVEESSQGTTISGQFGFTGELVIEFLIEEPPVQEKKENVTKINPANVSGTDSPSLLDKIFPGLTDNLFKKLKSDKFNIS